MRMKFFVGGYLKMFHKCIIGVIFASQMFILQQNTTIENVPKARF